MIDVLVPVLQRPQNAERFMASWRATRPEGVPCPLAIYGPNDPDTGAAWVAAGARVIYCAKEPGSFSQKINLAYGMTSEEWILLVGDDVHFHPRWFEEALACHEASGCLVIGTNDLGNGAVMSGQHATHMMIRRDYVDNLGASWDGPGVVCHEGYRHAYVDDEIVQAAHRRGTWASANNAVIEHMHPAWGKGEHDDIYAIGSLAMPADGGLFKQRSAAGYA